MKKIKVILSVLLMAAAISFTACSNASSGSDSDKTEKEDDKKTETPKPASGNGSGSGSGSGGGNQTPAVTYIGSKAPTAAKAVGDIVFTDGSATPYYMVNSLTAEKKQAAIAIIFYVGTDLNNEGDTTTVRTLGLGLKQNMNGRKWSTTTDTDIYISAITSEIQTDSEGNVTITGDKNGFDNLAQIGANLSTDDTATPENYPAFYFAKDYKNVTGSHVSGTVYENGWYLPSLGELYYIYLKGKSATKDFDIDAALQALGGDKFESRTYMSSSMATPGCVRLFSFEDDASLPYYIYLSDNYSICAIRDFTTYTVTLNTAEHGTVTANKTSAQAGETITLTATGSETENYAYKVSSFTINGQSSGSISDNTYTFTMPAANVTVSTNFTQMPLYSITITPCTGGTVTANKTRATSGETVTLTVTKSTEDNDYNITELTMNGSSLLSALGNNNTVTFSMPAGNTTVSATFVGRYVGSKRPSRAKEVGDIVFNDGSSMPYSTFTGLTSTETDSKKTRAIALIFYKGTGLNNGNDTTTVRTLGVGLKLKNNLDWCRHNTNNYDSDAAKGAYTNITTIQCIPSGETGSYTFTGDKYGKDNFEQIAAFLSMTNNDDTATQGNYPVFEFAKNYKAELIGSETTSRISDTSEFKDGWYIPSIAELYQIWENGKGARMVFDINDASIALGGDPFNPSYPNFWSSSQSDTPEYYIYKLRFNDGNIESRAKFWPFNMIYACCIREF